MRGTAAPAHIATRASSSLRSTLILVSLLAPAALAQTSPEPPPDQPYVLHLYTNLMQIPALVVDPHDHPVKDIDPKRFAISLDSGPKFRPAYVRQQGDDAISLSILLDLSGDTARLLPALHDALPALIPTVLHPKDHLSLYALDCSLVRSAEDIPADPHTLASAIVAAEARLHSPALSEPETSHCPDIPRLWDSIALLSKNLSTLPGRRMILVISNGRDQDSRMAWSTLHTYAATRSVAVFALKFTDEAPFPFGREEDHLHLLCDLTGGLALNISSKRDIPKELPRLFELMRSRYILEFHRPSNATSGLHDVAVSLDKSSARINTGGATVAVATPEELANPSDLPPAPSVETIGKRHPLDPH